MIIWPHEAESSEYREPLVRFSLPPSSALSHLFGSVVDHDSGETATYGFYWISEIYWIEVLGLVCGNVVLAALTGAIVYQWILLPDGQTKNDQPSTTGKLLGLGILLPLWIAWPTFIYQALGLQNLVIKFVVGGVTPTLTLFRLTEALSGCTPPLSKRSMWEFVVYFASVLVFERNETTGNYKKASWTKTIQHFRQFLGFLFLTGMVQSILTPHKDFNLFGAPIPTDGWFDMRRLLTWELYANTFLHAALFQLYLTTYCEGLTFFWLVTTGYQTKPVMMNPLGGSKSPSDFWGRRWNLLVQSVLKGGIYKPTRKLGYSHATAVLTTFVASGLFHEWLAHGLFSTACLDDTTSRSCYHPRYGGSMVFFLWQALLVAGEFVLGQTALVTQISQHLPFAVRTALVIAMGSPFGHFFVEPYVRSDYFRHGQFGLPMILRIDDSSTSSSSS